MSDTIPDLNVFMLCEELNAKAFSEVPISFSVRACRKNEYLIWKEMHIDDPSEYDAYDEVLEQYFQKVYKEKEEMFFQQCMFICDENDIPVATCFIWNAYGEVPTIHWLKVKEGFEGKGLGRAILTYTLRQGAKDKFPILVHTHPSSYKAIKLYMDFGFDFITDKKVGYRKNDFVESLEFLKVYLPNNVYKEIHKVNLTEKYKRILDRYDYEEF